MKRYVMIGAPVTTVRTPALLTAHLHAIGVAASIEARHVDPDDLGRWMAQAVADRTIDGLLVTMPHKRAMLGHLAAISQVARRAGSVNAARRMADGRFVGAQFDGIALVRALLARGMMLAGSRILLAGIGGAGLPIAQAILAQGCAQLSIADSDGLAVERALADLAPSGPVGAAVPGLGTRHDILVNATPLGMRAGDASPFDEDQVRAAACVADIVADPPRTRLADAARRAGIALVTGRDMVASQIEPIGAWLLADGLEQ